MLFKEAISHEIIDNIVNEQEIFKRSPLTEALGISIELNNDWYNLRKKMIRLEHVSLRSEGTDVTILSKGMSEFTQKCKGFFTETYEKFRDDVWGNFISSMEKQIPINKRFVDENKDIFLSKDLCGFTFEGYRWRSTYSLPIINSVYDGIDVFSFRVKDMMELNIEELQKGYDMSQNDITFNSIRKRAIDIQDSINGSELIDRCLDIYHGGTKEKVTLTCDDFSRLGILSTLSSYEGEIKNLKHKFDEICEFINNSEVYAAVSRGFLYDFLEKSDKTAEEMTEFYNKYMLALNTQLSWYFKMINIFIGVFACRLECYQDKLNEYVELVRSAVEFVGEEE